MNLTKKIGNGFKAASARSKPDYQLSSLSDRVKKRLLSSPNTLRKHELVLPDEAFIPAWFMHKPEINAFSIW